MYCLFVKALSEIIDRLYSNGEEKIHKRNFLNSSRNSISLFTINNYNCDTADKYLPFTQSIRYYFSKNNV